MRMWSAPPHSMCRRHLLGEHLEMHMFVGAIARGIRLGSFVSKGLVNTAKIQRRHDTLAFEMEARGYRHESPLRYDDLLAAGKIDRTASLAELHRRCPECRALYQRNQRIRR